MRDAFGNPRSLLVLGGSSDLAVATSRVLVSRGTRRVVLAGRDQDSLEQAASELRDAGGQVVVETRSFDALRADEHQSLVEDVFDSGGDVDAVLIAFGEYGEQAAMDADPAAVRRLIEVNFAAAASIAGPLVDRLMAQGHGALIVLSSTAAERPRASEYAYAASKAGLDAYFRGLGDRLADTGVRVMVVRPGFVPTKMTSHRRPRLWATTPQAVGEAIAAGLERDAELVWVPAGLRWVMAAA